MEKIIFSLNAIANYISKRQEPENEVLNVYNNVIHIIENQEISQSEVIIHQIEKYETIIKNIRMRYILKINYYI